VFLNTGQMRAQPILHNMKICWGKGEVGDWGMIVYNIFRGFQKSGIKSRGVLLFVPLRQLYTVLLIPLFCRLRDKCGTLWKAAWLHNVHNIRQKDIKMLLYLPCYVLEPNNYFKTVWNVKKRKKKCENSILNKRAHVAGLIVTL
jgi:hypothetical protein